MTLPRGATTSPPTLGTVAGAVGGAAAGALSFAVLGAGAGGLAGDTIAGVLRADRPWADVVLLDELPYDAAVVALCIGLLGGALAGVLAGVERVCAAAALGVTLAVAAAASGCAWFVHPTKNPDAVPFAGGFVATSVLSAAGVLWMAGRLRVKIHSRRAEAPHPEPGAGASLLPIGTTIGTVASLVGVPAAVAVVDLTSIRSSGYAIVGLIGVVLVLGVLSGCLVGTGGAPRAGGAFCGLLGAFGAVVAVTLLVVALTSEASGRFATMPLVVAALTVPATAGGWLLRTGLVVLRDAERSPAKASHRRDRRARLLGLDPDDAEEIASLLHDAAAAPADERSQRLGDLDRMSRPILWIIAVARAWSEPLRTALRWVTG